MPEQIEAEPKEYTSESYFRAIRLKCHASLWYHIEVGMNYTFVHPVMKDMVDWLQTKWNPLKPKRQNALVQVARDTFKSTCITQSLPGWALSQNPNLAILIVSKVYTNAQNFLSVQRRRFEQGQFIRIFGNWRTQRTWGEDRLTIATRTKYRREPSIMCAGINTSLTSMHFDIIIADDITNPLDMYSKAEREQTARLMKSLYDLIDKKTGLMAVVGTCWHGDDELEKIKKENPKKIKEGLLPFQIYRKPAEIQKNGKWQTTFPFLSPEVLKQVRMDKADIRDYSANYRLLPLAPEAQIFSEIHYFKYSFDLFKEMLLFVITIDPALGDDKKSCYAPIVTLGKRKDGRLLVLRANIKKRKPSVLIADLVDEYKFIKQFDIETSMYMEDNLFQEFLKDETINKALLKDEYLPLKGYSQHKNKKMRITRMEKYTTSGQVLFRDDWQTAENDYRLLLDQLTIFTQDSKEPEDGPDVLEMAVSIAIKGQQNVRFL